MLRRFFVGRAVVLGVLLVIGCAAWALLPATHQIAIFGQPTPTPPASPVITTEEPTTLLVVGDMMLGRYVDTLRTTRGEDYLFGDMRNMFARFDGVLGNLEGPIIPDAKPIPIDGMEFAFPTGTAPRLRAAGITFVSLANNHTDDQGKTGLESTRAALQEAGVAFFGAPSGAASSTVLRTTLGGRTIIFVGLNTTYGTLKTSDATALIKTLREEHPNAYLGVMTHWGNEYEPQADAFDETLAHRLIESGADAIFGTHPHVVQNIERYLGKPIFYSLGNFVFDQYFSEETQQGLAVGLSLVESGASYRLYPIHIAMSRPGLMTGTAGQAWLTALAARSAPDLRSEIQHGLILIAPRPPAANR